MIAVAHAKGNVWATSLRRSSSCTTKSIAGFPTPMELAICLASDNDQFYPDIVIGFF